LSGSWHSRGRVLRQFISLFDAAEPPPGSCTAKQSKPPVLAVARYDEVERALAETAG
jgi:hypothetical protein